MAAGGRSLAARYPTEDDESEGGEHAEQGKAAAAELNDHRQPSTRLQAGSAAWTATGRLFDLP
jgi:hypothetical protein